MGLRWKIVTSEGIAINISTKPEQDRLTYSLGAMVSGDIMRRCTTANDKNPFGFVFKGISVLHGVYYLSRECILISSDERGIKWK